MVARTAGHAVAEHHVPQRAPRGRRCSAVPRLELLARFAAVRPPDGRHLRVGRVRSLELFAADGGGACRRSASICGGAGQRLATGKLGSLEHYAESLRCAAPAPTVAGRTRGPPARDAQRASSRRGVQRPRQSIGIASSPRRAPRSWTRSSVMFCEPPRRGALRAPGLARRRRASPRRAPRSWTRSSASGSPPRRGALRAPGLARRRQNARATPTVAWWNRFGRVLECLVRAHRLRHRRTEALREDGQVVGRLDADGSSMRRSGRSR